MAEILKPSNLSLTWASGGDVLNPGDTKYATGWQVEIPPRQWFNYLDNRQDSAIAHINQHGVVAWDNTTEYQEDKSYVQGVTNGTVYRCVQTHTNQDPEIDVGNVYWIIAFASAGDFYTKAEVDADFLAKDQNLGDLPSAPDARNNLNVYSKTETYTKTEVDGKTTVASALQAQQQTSNAVILTPQRLSDALKGGNQSLTTNGFQRLPGGLILQWGSVVLNTTPTTFDFPTAFSSAVLTLIGSDGNSAEVAYTAWQPTSLTQFSATASGSNIASKWIAIGI